MDIVTDRLANLHNETMRLMEADGRFHMPRQAELYAVAYRPVRRGQTDVKEEIDLWPLSLGVGDKLPMLPLVLNWEHFVSVDLEAAYMDACRRRRLV